MDKQEIIKKITSKKEFSELPEKDVQLAFEKFEKRQTSDEEKIKLTRDLLRKSFFSFASTKLLKLRDRNPDWALKKHLSTKERFPHYKELYEKLLKNFQGNVFDLGAGVNGFSFEYFPKKINYIGIESVGQLVDLMNYYFKKNNFKGKAIHESLFNLKEIKKYLKQVGSGTKSQASSLRREQKEKKVVFLFKVLDSLEMIERDYSKKILNEIVPLADRIVISFATESLVSRKKFKVERYWIKQFIEKNFRILDEFELGPEKYLVISN